MNPRPQHPHHHKPAKAHGKDEAQRRVLSHPEILRIIFGLMLSMFLGALDQTIVATALPTIGRHFNDLGNLAWIVTAYLLTGTAVTPLYGKLSDVYGRRVVMLSAIGLFIAGSVACAMSPSMSALIFARALQGAGGGGLMALAQTIIADVISPRERGRYQGYIAAVFATSSVGGPVLGGFLTEHFDWSLIFWINVPVGLIALGVTSQSLKLVPYHPRKHRLDVIGALLMISASVALLLALSWGGREYAWISAPIGALFLSSAVLWMLFAWRLAAAAEPFLPLSVLGNPVVRSAALTGACTMGALVGMTIFVPLYFEVVLHLSASQSGLALIPLMASSVLGSTIVGRLMMRVTHYKRVPLFGSTVAILALGSLAIWPAAMPMWLVLVMLAVIGTGFGTVFPVSTVCLQNAVPHAQMGIATGAANFFRALFSSLVVAILGAIVLGGLGGETGAAVETLARTASADVLAIAFRFVFLACGLVLAFGMAFLIALEERPLQGPPSAAAEAPTAPATSIPNVAK
ncbi:MFS transporter [Microbacteriaceae bacterium K1510]|nr:MFS transporter [Microbacteriaceae bacterium K1510]